MGHQHDRKSGRRVSGALLTLCLLGISAAAGAAEVPVLEASVTEATAGFYRLSWTSPGDSPEFELQESSVPEFERATTMYRGLDQASVLTGRKDGRYYYRVRARLENGTVTPWSDPVQVTVKHHSLGRALRFFATGAVVFLATLGLIAGGTLRAQRLE
ncbi:MAG: fibronectin type III domain-containing protein [Gammaproteobacteria bacterium]|nr:fibronectin type III domain-containing protein [Gammaproteobacteria bacterium]NIR98241.1 fibronectin type III domain-containing protein [Gammaproteobacteria bacterium]NIT63912.1 fibronectin type III domain-containing protein [Gammaproteobacteria bacterium]NIV20916.1 fibronectin type III domain-containing protein [Gammaproteobacteria bacterium]NIY32492.1 fibronectin type III domain-containing protein [Gammaproteobacteria bacterium]